MEPKVNVHLPFIAIREDVRGSIFTRTLGEYFCNPLDEDVLDVEISLGGFSSAEELGVMESDETKHPSFVVPAGEAVRFELSTRDEYDEMSLHWSVRYRTLSRGHECASFGTFKRLSDTLHFDDVPALGGPGEVVPRSQS